MIDSSVPQLSRWQVVRRLGAGGFGTVFEARHRARADLRVALKVSKRSDPADRRRFVREARALSRIEDEHIVEIRDFGSTDDGLAYLAMDLLEGEDLSQALAARGPLPWSEAREIVQQLLHAVAAVHAAGLTHRDIKPSNCFLTDEGGRRCVRLIDFGLARVAEADEEGEDPTRVGCVTRTYEYMAPERFLHPERVDARADLYSIGILMFRVLVGRLPFRAPTRELVPAMQVQQPPPRPCRWRPSIPARVESIILRALAKDPDHRYPDAAAMIEALESVPADAPGAGPDLRLELADTIPEGFVSPWAAVGSDDARPGAGAGAGARSSDDCPTVELSEDSACRSWPRPARPGNAEGTVEYGCGRPFEPRTKGRRSPVGPGSPR